MSRTKNFFIFLKGEYHLTIWREFLLDRAVDTANIHLVEVRDGTGKSGNMWSEYSKASYPE